MPPYVCAPIETYAPGTLVTLLLPVEAISLLERSAWKWNEDTQDAHQVGDGRQLRVCLGMPADARPVNVSQGVWDYRTLFNKSSISEDIAYLHL